MPRSQPLSSPLDIAAQSAALSAVLDRVAEVASGGHRPVVQIDLDLTALCPRFRTRQALAAAAATFPVPEWADGSSERPVLPGYTDEAWRAFLDGAGLRARYPDWVWEGNHVADSVQAAFHANYWTTAWLIEDEPTPGLGAFVRRIEDRGGVAVFLSGRWRAEQIPPSRAALQRAGIPRPNLLIGNHLHEENVVPAKGERAWSDGQVKRRTQAEIRERYGVPVAVFDDRKGNRDAIAEANHEYLQERGLADVIGVAVAVPGFTHDPATAAAPLRITTFESFAPAAPDPRREPYLAARYRPAGAGAYHGLVTGLGRNGHGYVLPRRVPPGPSSQPPPSGYHPHFRDLAGQNGLPIEAFMAEVERTIPADVVGQLRDVLVQAESEARLGLAAPYPEDLGARQQLWHSLACSWLHSRDLEVVMAAVGYPLAATGLHDMSECAPAEDVIAAVVGSLDAGDAYSDWFLRWVQRLDRRGSVNVDFLNPNLTVSTWRWRPDAAMNQDAMDAHRVSAHHNGNGQGRYDPVEATVNNLLHAREGPTGVQKSPVMSWAALDAAIRTLAGADALAKSSWGGALLRDAVPILRGLEERGYVMPWGVVAGPPAPSPPAGG